MNPQLKTAIDPLAQQVARFVADYYLPRMVRFIRRNLSTKTIAWTLLAGAVVAVPFALAAAVRVRGERTTNRRYDINDYLSDDLA